ncbi:MAG: Glycosyl transferase group 1 [Thermoplasmatales archaeon E-plasma]|nr:MAG: Glycosyl transferase group 1 [Thermoplasmatales archaeon E-plasma]EQB65761.1 MAG: Glycosyl transferase group 1 [Thermoplasmatales archaeon E-plasma]
MSIDTGVPKNPIRIYSEFPLSYGGGGERSILLIYNFLKDSGMDVTVIQNGGLDLENRMSPTDLQERLKTDLQEINFRRLGFPKFIYQDFPPLELLVADQSTCSIILLRRGPPRSVLKKLRTSNSKIIFCLHGIAIEKFRVTSFSIMVHQLIMRKQLRNLAQFLGDNIFAQCLTPNIVSFLRNAGGHEENIFKIETDFESDVLKINPNNDEFKVIFIGRMQNLTKGIRMLKKVVNYIAKIEPSIKFIIIGSGKDSSLLTDVGENVRLLGNSNDEEKKIALQESNLAIITSNLEPFSLVSLEYITSGLPVVTTPASGPSYLIGKDPNYGKTSSFNFKIFSDDIIKFYQLWLSNKGNYYELRKEIAKKSRQMFRQSNMLESYGKMIEEVNSR